MPLTPPRYTILLADPEHPDDLEHATEHDVYVLHGDQLRAELEGPRNGVPDISKAPLHGVTLWIWASLMRSHVIEETYKVFRPRLLVFEEVKDVAAPGDVAGPQDPTQADPSASPSSSPATSETSADGLTPPPIPVS